MEPASEPGQPRANFAPDWSIIVPLLVAIPVMLTFVTIPPAAVDLDMDADTSWCAVLEYAHRHGLQFGTDLVFTYGPLGYLISFYFSPHSGGTHLVSSVALCWTVAAGLCLVAWRLRLAWRCLLIGVFVFVAANLPLRTDLVIDVGFLCWGLLCFAYSGRGLVVSMLVFLALAVFCALAKTTHLFMGCISTVLVAAGLAARGHWRTGAWMIVGFCAGFTLGWLAASQNLWHLGSYLSTAVVIVKGYNEANGWEALPEVVITGIALALSAIALMFVRAWAAGQARKRGNVWLRGVLFAWLAALLFLVWKHGLVRGDAYHAVYFFGFVPVLALTLGIVPGFQGTLRYWIGALTAVCCLTPVLVLQSLFFLPVPGSLWQPFRAFGYNLRCLVRPADYCKRMNAVVEAKRRQANLPRLREVIGKASADVFGSQQIYAIYNDLNYRPRPVFQSYTASNRRLMTLNEHFYLSEAAPEYVLFALGGMDRRFAPLDDAMTLRHLVMNYAPAGAEGGFLLLKRQSSAPCRLTLLGEGTVQLGMPIDLTAYTSTNLWLEIVLEPSLTGRLRELLYRPPIVRLAAMREPSGGLLTRRRAPAVMLSAGFFASPLLMRTDDVLKLQSNHELQRPGAYSVELLPGQSRFWGDAVRFRVFEISR